MGKLVLLALISSFATIAVGSDIYTVDPKSAPRYYDELVKKAAEALAQKEGRNQWRVDEVRLEETIEENLKKTQMDCTQTVATAIKRRSDDIAFAEKALTAPQAAQLDFIKKVYAGLNSDQTTLSRLKADSENLQGMMARWQLSGKLEELVDSVDRAYQEEITSKFAREKQSLDLIFADAAAANNMEVDTKKNSYGAPAITVKIAKDSVTIQHCDGLFLEDKRYQRIRSCVSLNPFTGKIKGQSVDESIALGSGFGQTDRELSESEEEYVGEHAGSCIDLAAVRELLKQGN